MNKDIFWEIIEKAKTKANDNQEAMRQEVYNQLVSLNPNDIVDWKIIFDEYEVMARIDKLREVAGSIQDHISSSCDGFLDFRVWLIGQGKDAYHNVLKNHNSLLSIAKDCDIEFEALGYVASDAFEAISNEDFYEVYNSKNNIARAVINSTNNIHKSVDKIKSRITEIKENVKMTQSNYLQENKELRELKSLIVEKTGYSTEIGFTTNDDDGNKEYEIHVSANDTEWHYTNIPCEDVDEAYNMFMYELLHCPSRFKFYDIGTYGVLLKSVLEANSMGDIGYTMSYGEFWCFDGGVVKLCKCADITKLTVETDLENEVVITIIAGSKKITITDDKYTIE